MATRGRPCKSDVTCDNKQKIIDTTIELIKTHGADFLTVRNVCQAAEVATGTFYHYFRNKDDLLMYFIRDISFDKCELKTPIRDISGRVCELYMNLIDRYMELGRDFMRNFYTTDNQALSAYMGVTDGRFAEGTVMERCECELLSAQENGIIKKNADIHILSADICTIVKGCVFEWCLNDGEMDITSILDRIIGSYIQNHLNKGGKNHE